MSNFPSYNANQTRFLTLNQPLPGEEDRRSDKRPERIYRAQKAPNWVVEGDEPEPEEPTFVDRMHGVGWEEEEEDVETTEAGALYEERLREAQSGPKEGSPVAEVIEPPTEFDLSKLQDLEVPEPAPLPADNQEESARARMRTKMRQKEIKVHDIPEPQIKGDRRNKGDSGSESGSSDSEEYESDFEPSRPRRMKPMFLGKRERKKIATRSRPEEEKHAMDRYTKELAIRRREDARRSLIEIIRAEDNLRNQESSEEEMPNTDDEDEDEQFEAWKLRELKRIKREKDALDAIEQEKVDLGKRRQMSNVEIERDNELHGVDRSRRAPKARMKFMQKYYHKGAFYQDDTLVNEKIMKRNYISAPTKEDKWLNFENLPKVMQVKNWGMASRTKYTHLVDQDTTVQGSGDFDQVKSNRATQQNVDQLADYEEDIWRDSIRSMKRGGPQTMALDRIAAVKKRRTGDGAGSKRT